VASKTLLLPAMLSRIGCRAKGDSQSESPMAWCSAAARQRRRTRQTSVTANRKRPTLGVLIYFAVAFGLGVYFTFAAVQGDYGLFRRAEIEADTRQLQAQLDSLSTQVARMENLTRRLSDTYLDLDLLDQQARDVLGLLRSDEIVIR